MAPEAADVITQLLLGNMFEVCGAFNVERIIINTDESIWLLLQDERKKFSFFTILNC